MKKLNKLGIKFVVQTSRGTITDRAAHVFAGLITQYFIYQVNSTGGESRYGLEAHLLLMQGTRQFKLAISFLYNTPYRFKANNN